MSDFVIIEKENLSNLANGIKDSEENLSLKELADKANETKQSITNALNALAEKGVEVPAGASSNDLAKLITSIEAGGGLQIASGSITLTKDIPNINSYRLGGLGTFDGCCINIAHNLGKIPAYGFLINTTSGLLISKNGLRYGAFYFDGTDYVQYYSGHYESSRDQVGIGSSTFTVTATEYEYLQHLTSINAVYGKYQPMWCKATADSIMAVHVGHSFINFLAGQTFTWLIFG